MACCTLLRTAWRLSGLVRKSYAPSFIAATAASTVPYAVIRTTSASGATARTPRSSSWPLIPGIIRSVSTTSTDSPRRISRAFSALAESSTRQPSRAKMRSSESRFACSSSTTRTVPCIGGILLGEQGADEFVRIELLQIRHRFADADVAHGDLQLVADADDHAALGGAVELGEHEAGHAQRLVEQPRLLDGVLPGGGVDHQQHLVRRARVRFLQRALDALELVHEVGLGVQAAGGVAEHHVDLLVARAGDRVEQHRAGIAAVLAAHDRHLRAIGPDVELLARRRAKSVARAHQHRLARDSELRRQLADGGGLPGAVHAHDHDHLWCGRVGQPAVTGLARRGPERKDAFD